MRRIVAALGALLLSGWSAAAQEARDRPERSYDVEAEKFFSARADDAVTTLTILSTADLDIFEPLIRGFQNENPAISVRYLTVSSAALYQAMIADEEPFDLAISSAMDLQTKLANDGFAQTWRSVETQALPSWARWRDRLFAFTQEPSVIVLSRAALSGAPPPRSRIELIDLIKSDPDRFRGKIGGYDVRVSGLGYLFATQDSRRSESFWRLMEVIGGLEPKFYCCSSDMIAGLERGELLVAYNVLGSYAAERVDAREDLLIAPLTDYTHIMLRTAMIPASASHPEAAGRFIDFLVAPRTRRLILTKTGLRPIDPAELTASPSLRPISLGPGLMVFLDKLKRREFLEAWTRAAQQ